MKKSFIFSFWVKIVIIDKHITELKFFNNIFHKNVFDIRLLTINFECVTNSIRPWLYVLSKLHKT